MVHAGCRGMYKLSVIQSGSLCSMQVVCLTVQLMVFPRHPSTGFQSTPKSRCRQTTPVITFYKFSLTTTRSSSGHSHRQNLTAAFIQEPSSVKPSARAESHLAEKLPSTLVSTPLPKFYLWIYKTFLFKGWC